MDMTELCQYLRNWFERGKYYANFKIENGVCRFADDSDLPLLDGQYYRIVGSVLNDGVHKYGDEEDAAALKTELFNGAVWSMAVPPAVITLCEDIDKWVTEHAEAIDSPFQSESFGGYSYSKGYSSAANATSISISWQSQYASRLAPWRKI